MTPEQHGRFLAKVTRGPGCWLWTAGCDRDGYGQLSVDDRIIRTHRLSYEHFVGPIPHGAHVLHSCDAPACCNPDHLRAGTHVENMADMVARGRTAGERNGQAKLTANDVRHIRVRIALGEPQVGIAKVYGVAPTTIQSIASGKSWAALDA